MFGKLNDRRTAASGGGAMAGSVAVLRIAVVATFVAAAVLGSSPAQAQFTCTTTPTDVTCTNSGTSAGFLNSAAGANQNGTTTNSGTVNGSLTTATTAGGNATGTNSGSVGQNFGSETSAGGNATGTNSGSVGQNFFVETVAGGNASGTNSGSVGQLFIVETGAGGSATATNSGGVGQSLQVVTLGGGDATGTNSGSIGQTFNVATQAGGNAAGTNSGNVGQTFSIETFLGGNVTATNSGSVGQFFQVETIGGGNATGTNSGSVGLSFAVETFLGGNATGTNSGSVGQTFVVETLAGGNATGTSSGSVGQTFVVETIAGGNATGTSSGSVGQTFVVETNAGGNATGINSGSVGQNFIVETIAGGNATAINSGSINGGAVVGALGGGTSSLTNSGIIRNTLGGPAIQFFGGPDTLNLLAGSTIIGNIFLVGTNDHVNFLSGNHNLTFSGPGLTGATVGGAIPFAVSGNRAAAVDPTPFAYADRSLMDFTRGISDVLGSLGGASAPSGAASTAFAPSESDSMAARVDDALAGLGIPALAYAGDTMPLKAPTMVTSDGRAVWARGFGGEHVQDADGPLVRATTIFAGGAVGFDMLARPDLRLGVFAGGGQTRESLDINLGHTDSDTAFGGVYGRWGFVSFGAPSFLDFALHGGGSSNSTARTINNNTLPGGIEIATASYNSAYVSPEAAYGVNLPLWSEYTLTPSVRVRYVAGFFDGYTESGTTAPLTVGNRTIQDFEERGQVKLTHTTTFGGGDQLLTSVHVGALGLERVGDTTVNTVLLGANLPFVTPGKNTVGGVLGGGGLEWRTREGVSFFGAAEAIGFSDSSTVYDARGGIRVAF